MQLHPRIAEEGPQSSNGLTPGSTVLQRSAVAARLGRMFQVLKELLRQARFLAISEIVHIKYAMHDYVFVDKLKIYLFQMIGSAVAARRLGCMFQVLKELLCHTGTLLS